MTQALLNNLNILQDSNLSLNDNNTKNVVNDFEKVLGAQTQVQNNATENNIQNQTTKDVSAQNQNVSESVQETNVESIKPQVVKQETDNTDNKIAVLQEEIEAGVKECAIETVIDLTIIKDVYADTEADSTSNNTEENKNAKEEIITTEDTSITEEDSTMNKELNTLQNPTTALLVQTQIPAVTHKNSLNEVSNEELCENVNIKTSNKNLNNDNLNTFKQLENNNSKDSILINVSPKETPKSENDGLKHVLNEKIVKDLNIQSVNSETTENQTSSNDLMQNQTPQEQAVKVMIQGDIKYENTISEVVKTAEVKPAEISPSKIIEQISKQLENMYNNTKLNIVLNPGSLGKVNLQVFNTKDGLMAQFTVTTQEARDLLMQGLNSLKDSLLAQGISIDNVSVKLDEVSENENQFDWTEQDGSRGGNKNQGSKKQEKENEKPFEQMMFELENNDKV